MVTTTTTYSFKKPTVGQDEDLWGGYLNDSMDLIDDVLDGTTPITGIDINSGTIDNAVIGGSTPAAGTFTTLTATSYSGDGSGLSGINTDLVGDTTPQLGGNLDTNGFLIAGRNIATDGTKLDGIESGATADQTKADIDALGINAATLDSLDSTQFLRSDASDTTSGVLTATDGMISEYIDLGTQGNRTIQGLSTRATIGSSGGYGDLHLQHYGGDLHTVHGGGTLYANGNTVWHAGNDGVGSGLDADLLDGQHGSYYTNAGNLTGTIGDVFSSTTRYNIGYIDGASSSNRDKLRVWNSSSYTIGMSDGYTFGGLNNDYAMSFQMNDDSDRGFWWGDVTHTNAAGAMALTTDGKLTVARGMRLGFGETDTTIPSDQTLAVNGTVTAGNATFDNGTSTLVDVVCDDNGTAGIRLYGPSQGTGYVEVGQSTAYGGGMYYNGDGSPAFASGETADTIGFYRLSNGTRTEVFSYPYSSNDVTFNGNVTASAFYGDGSNLTNLPAGAPSITGTVSSVANNATLQIEQVQGGNYYVKYYRSGYTSVPPWLQERYWQANTISNNPYGVLYLQMNDPLTSTLDPIYYASFQGFTFEVGVTAPSYTTSSDINLKENIVGITDAVTKVQSLNGYYYNLIGKDETKLGVIAQEVEVNLPELVKTQLKNQEDFGVEGAETFKTVEYQGLIPLLIEAIKEQQSTITALEARITALEG